MVAKPRGRGMLRHILLLVIFTRDVFLVLGSEDGKTKASFSVV